MVTTNEKKKDIKIKVLRPFFVDGKVIEAGKEVTLPFHLAREMIAANKATEDLNVKLKEPKKETKK